MNIGNVKIEGKTVLAPMAGVADTAFRLLCRAHGAAFVVGEMASAKALTLGDKKTQALLAATPDGHPMAAQLFGGDPAAMGEAARRAADFGADILDINMGCPVPKVVSTGAGSALMRDEAKAACVIEAVVKASPVPVAVKMRTGWDDAHKNCVALARIAQECGAAAVTVHGRTRAQMYAPPADLASIAAVKRAVSIPVIGNGDVRTPEDARRMLDETGCDLVMVGRGALGAPWVFGQIGRFLETGAYDPAPPLPQRMEILRRHITLLCSLRGERPGMREARRHAAWYFRGEPGAAALRNEAVRLETLDDLERLIEHALCAGGAR